jgi:alkylhydroperoxidase/carboxymuconolactone decarboxylase family protein YurZ
MTSKATGRALFSSWNATTLSPPSEIQSALLQHLRQSHPQLHEQWAKAIERTTASELDVRTRAVVLASTAAAVHWPTEAVKWFCNAAFDHGSCIVEMIEAVMCLAALHSGGHGLHHGLQPLAEVIEARQREGLPTPKNGGGLGPDDMTPEAPWPNPPVFPYQSPYPRVHNKLMATYHPKVWAEYKKWNDARFNLREELTRRMFDLLYVGCDITIIWPEPLLDHHIHASFEAGVTAQEMAELSMLCATTLHEIGETAQAQQALHHGLDTLSRVLAQRQSHDLLAPIDATQPKTGRIALTSP